MTGMSCKRQGQGVGARCESPVRQATKPPDRRRPGGLQRSKIASKHWHVRSPGAESLPIARGGG
jgi:hypothetical protein